MEVDSANALELDLCMTKEGVIVVWHDWDPDSPIALAREAGLEPDVKYRPLYPAKGSSWRRQVHTLTLAELRAHYGFALKDGDTARSVPAWIPTLDEFLAIVSRYDRLRLVYLDLKIPEEQSALTSVYFNTIRKSLDAAAPRFTVVFMTPHQKIFDQIEQIYPGENITFDVEPPPGIVLEPWEINSARTAIERGNAYASTVQPKASTWAPWTTLKRLIENDVRMRDEHNRTNPRNPVKAVVAATITAPDNIRCLIATGVDGIITDDPKRLREIAREMGRTVD
jgi:glycerophosphoryl diester phosphodiesterase